MQIIIAILIIYYNFELLQVCRRNNSKVIITLDWSNILRHHLVMRKWNSFPLWNGIYWHLLMIHLAVYDHSFCCCYLVDNSFELFHASAGNQARFWQGNWCLALYVISNKISPWFWTQSLWMGSKVYSVTPPWIRWDYVQVQSFHCYCSQ